jgi:hypothetical protein
MRRERPFVRTWRSYPILELYPANLLIRWCNYEFLDDGSKLLPPPADSRAVLATAAASLSGRLKAFIS